MKSLLKRNEYLILVFINILAISLDYFYLKNTSNIPPAWDQGYHLSNLFKMQNIISSNSINILEKWNNILDVSDNYRGPLSYIISSFPLLFSKNSYTIAYLSNNIYNLICIFSIYEFCKIIKLKETGIWAAFIFSFSPIIINQRTTYLIDLPLTAFSFLLFLVLTKWYISKSEHEIYPFFAGLIYAFIFLIKPTGIIFFIIPLIILSIKKFIYIRSSNKHFLKEFLIFIFTFTFLIYPWFSRHWITIISSTLNAWQWGIKYQEGLDANSIGGWLFYFKKLPSILGELNLVFILLFITYGKLTKKGSIKKSILRRDVKIWIAIFTINIYVIISLMSTKDMRFIMPIFPLICIFCSTAFENSSRSFINNNYKKTTLVLSIIITLTTNNNYLIEGILQTNNKDIDKGRWFHSEVIEEIYNQNPYLVQTLAILPDTKEINTFNFEAEAVKQGEFIKVRQVVSNINTYKDDLKYFDWFLIKTNNQGIMTNESKNLLTSFLINNSTFKRYKEWELPDNTKITLLKRKELNSKITEESCYSNNNSLNIKYKISFLDLELVSKGDLLRGSYLILNNIDSSGNKKELNISLANGLFNDKFNPENCYRINQRIKLENNLLLNNKKFNPEILFINPSLNDGKPINIATKIFSENNQINSFNEILFNNKLSDVIKLGNFLRNGEFEDLFNLVGILNQSDPDQNYLKDAENIYKLRINQDENTENLYSLLISQILQRKVEEANLTIKKITRLDPNNGNAFLTKSIIETYLLKKNDAKNSLRKAKSLKMSSESLTLTNIFDGIFYLAELKFFNAYKTFSN